MQTAPYRNTILQHLHPEVLHRLQLRPVALELNQDLEIPGEHIQHLYFVEQGIGSMTTIFKDGFQVEVGMFGYESAVGVSALMGTKRSLNRIFMQMHGHGFSSPIEVARKEFDQHGQFHRLALRYVQAQLTQATQSAACNAHHSHEQRLARWLLICCDRSNETTVDLSQDFLAMMLGCTRPTLSVAAANLKKHSLIDYHRGHIRVLDPAGLETVSCECYCVIKDHLDNFAEFDTGFVV